MEKNDGGSKFIKILKKYRKVYKALPKIENSEIKSPEQVILHIIELQQPDLIQSVTTPDGIDIRRLVLQALDQKNVKLKTLATALLLLQPISSPYEVYTKAFSDSDPSVRYAAAAGLSQYQDRDTAFVLFTNALKDKDSKVWNRVASKLGHFPDPHHAFEIFMTAFSAGKEISWNDHNLDTALDKYIQKNQGDLLTKLMNQPDFEIQKASSKALKSYLGKDRNSLILRALNHGHWEIQNNAASAISNVSLDNLDEIISTALKCVTSGARVKAIESLSLLSSESFINSDQALEFLNKGLKDRTIEVQSATIKQSVSLLTGETRIHFLLKSLLESSDTIDQLEALPPEDQFKIATLIIENENSEIKHFSFDVVQYLSSSPNFPELFLRAWKASHGNGLMKPNNTEYLLDPRIIDIHELIFKDSLSDAIKNYDTQLFLNILKNLPSYRGKNLKKIYEIALSINKKHARIKDVRESLGTKGDMALINELIHDSTPQVSKQAILSLQHYNGSIDSTLEDIFSTQDADLIRKGLFLLSRYRGENAPKYFKVAAQLLRESDFKKVGRNLGIYCNEIGSPKLIYQFLKDANWRVAEIATHSLDTIKIDVDKILSIAAYHSHPKIREVAQSYFDKSSDELSFSFYEDSLANEHYVEVPNAFRTLHNRTNYPDIIQYLVNSSVHFVRSNTLNHFYYVFESDRYPKNEDRKKICGTLFSILSSPVIQERYKAAKELSICRDEFAFEAYNIALDDPSYKVRKAATKKFFSKYKGPNETYIFSKVLQDPILNQDNKAAIELVKALSYSIWRMKQNLKDTGNEEVLTMIENAEVQIQTQEKQKKKEKKSDHR